jgi:hypothetical protein
MPANRKRLTETTVTNLPTKRKAYRVWDAGAECVRGLHVLVQPGRRLATLRRRIVDAMNCVAVRCPHSLAPAGDLPTRPCTLPRCGVLPLCVS